MCTVHDSDQHHMKIHIRKYQMKSKLVRNGPDYVTPMFRENLTAAFGEGLRVTREPAGVDDSRLFSRKLKLGWEKT